MREKLHLIQPPQIMNESITQSPSQVYNKAKTMAVYHFTHYNSGSLNRSLRQKQLYGWGSSSAENRQVEALNQIANESRTIGEQTFYRGCGVESFKKPDGSFYGIEEIIVNPAFSSTSTDPKIAAGFANGQEGTADLETFETIKNAPISRVDGIVYEIKVPKDYPIIEVNRFLGQNNIQNIWSNQEEIILSNNGVYKVVEIKKDDQGKIIKVKLEAQKEFANPEKLAPVEPRDEEQKQLSLLQRIGRRFRL
jgi:hypothetical protein